MSTKSKVALGALVGAVAGIIAGVLTAPKSGKETRTNIKEKASELKSKSIAAGHHKSTTSNDLPTSLSKAPKVKKK